MPSLGSLYYTLGIKDLTDADLKKINAQLKRAGSKIQLSPEILKDRIRVPKGIKIELDPIIKSATLAKAVEGKTMRVAVTPLLKGFREAIVKATRENPPQAEVGVSEVRLRTLIQNVLNKQGFLLNISTVNDNYSKAIQAKLNGTRYNVKIHADAKEITQSVQASLMQVQSRYFGLKVSRDILYRSIDEALGQKRFPISVYVRTENARSAVQTALNKAAGMSDKDILSHKRLVDTQLNSAKTKLLELKAAQMGAADAAKTHASASINLGGAMGSNIKIAGELGSAMASMYSIHAAKQFLSQVIEIGGELEHQKIAMNTIFGDKGKTNELFGQIKGLARQSPFGVMELTKSVKALSAYGVQYNEIYDTAKRLADISAATSVDINRLILAFGKTKSRGFLDGLEAKQFAYANMPIYEMVRRKLEELEGQAVTTAQVMERMKKREISFDIVKDVLWDMTDPGGKFYDMQEALAGSVKTSWKLVRDNIELMFGEIAEGSVGSGLKSIAEMLQGLTRNWRALGTVIGTAAAAFGIYRIAVMASNVMMGKATAANFAHLASQAKLNASLAKSALTYRGLSAEEGRQFILKNALQKVTSKNIFATNALTTAETQALVAERALTRNSAARLIAMGKITPLQARYLVQQKLITAGDLHAAFVARKHGISINLLGKEIRIATFRFKMLGAAIGASLKALGVFTLKSLPLLALTALMSMWQKNDEQMEKAKEIGENIFTKATEGANNLKQTLQALKPSAGLSEHELAQGIEQMEQAIKDYSPRPLQDINDTLVAQNGHVLTLAERYDALRNKVEGVAAAYKVMGDADKGDVGAMVSSAIKSTGGLLDDTVTVNAKDYTEALKRRSDVIRNLAIEEEAWMRKAVEAAMNSDHAFAQAAKSMKNTAAMFNELASNPNKYTSAYENPTVLAVMASSGVTDANRSIAEEQQKFESDIQGLIKSVTVSIRTTWDKEIKDLDASQKDALAIGLKNMLDQADGVSEEVKTEWARILEKAFGIDMGFKADATALIRDEFAANMDKLLGKELADKVRRGLTLTPEEKGKVHHAIYESYKSVFSRSDEDVRRALNDSMRGNMQLQTIGLVSMKVNRNANATDWQQQILDALGDADLSPIGVKITGHSDINSFIDEARKGYKAANEAVKELKPILIKAGIDFVDGKEITSVPLSLKGNEVALNAIDEYNNRIRATKALKEALGSMGIDLDVDPNKRRRTPKDTFADNLKQRFKDIKDAWSEFQKWSKTEGREAAAKRIGESGLFSTLSADKIPQTVEQYRALVVELENELRQAGVKGTARESLLNELLKQLLDIDKTVVDEQLRLALDKVSKEAERQLADWNLFDKIRKATGNQDLAMSIAFGMDADAETDYPAMIKQQLQKTVDAAEAALSKGVTPYEVQGYNYDKLKKLYDARDTDEGMEAWTKVPQEIRNAWEKANGDILKYFDQQRDAVADILNEYQSLQDKLAKIDSDRDRKIQTVQGSDMSAPDKAKYTQRINVEADYQKFTQSADYLKFFSGIYSLTMQQAQEIGDKIRLNLDQRLQAGTISAEDYYKEIGRINQQLTKLRNVKSDALTFMTGGVKGLNQKKLEIADSNVLDQMTKVQQAQEALEMAKKTGDIKQIAAAEQTLNLAKTELDTRIKIRDAIVKDMEGWQKVLDVVNVVANIGQGLSDAFNSIREMAGAFGVDTESGGWEAIGGVLDTVNAVTGGVQKVMQSAMNGDIGGILSGAVSTITTPFTIWSQLHDKKLQKLIERSKQAAQIMQNQYDILEKRMANFLGNAADMNVEGYTGQGGAYGKQRELMQGQLRELEKQRQAEMDKKKSDSSVVEDYNRQIEEMKIAIRDFAIEAAKDLYGIDLNGWAKQLGDSLVDAFAKGEDAAAAFDKTVGDIMRDVVSKMISQDILAPMFGDLRNFLFGTDGVSGAFGSDFKLDASETAAMKTYLDKIKDEGIPAAEELFNAINNATGGLLDDTDRAKSGLSAGIQSVTEDTADLLASYINAIRASVAMNEGRWERLLGESLPQISVIAQSQLDAQRQIAENTLRTAKATEAIVKSNDDISRLLTRVSQGGAKWHI